MIDAINQEPRLAKLLTLSLAGVEAYQQAVNGLGFEKLTKADAERLTAATKAYNDLISAITNLHNEARDEANDMERELEQDWLKQNAPEIAQFAPEQTAKLYSSKVKE